jgi:DNA-binding CsgD family transcriptional regulator
VATASDRDHALTVLAELSPKLVPADRGGALFAMKGEYPQCIRWPEYAAERVREFNTYYNRQVPVHFSGAEPVLGPVDWREYRDSEYVADFHRPLGIDCSVGASFVDAFSRTGYVLWIHRHGRGARFAVDDVETLRLLCRQVGHIISLKSEIEAARRDAVSDPELGPDADILSRREAEVARLMCRRVSFREIAAILRISPRTVERHASHIYHKLRVANRKELAALLLRRAQDEGAHGRGRRPSCAGP